MGRSWSSGRARRGGCRCGQSCSRIAHVAAADSDSMGRRIAAARARAGLTQEHLASRVSLNRSALAKIENGSRRVSALEFARIADAVGERIEWFVMETPPAIVSHRNVNEPGTACPTIDRIVERAAWNVEFVLDHDDRLSPAAPTTMRKPQNAAEAELCAAKVRQLLDIDQSSPFFDLSGHLARLGMLVFSIDLGPDAADAASMHLGQGGLAVLNGHL